MPIPDNYLTPADNAAYFKRLIARTSITKLEQDQILKMFDVLSNFTEPVRVKDMPIRTLKPPMSPTVARWILTYMANKGLVIVSYKRVGREPLCTHYQLVSHKELSKDA